MPDPIPSLEQQRSRILSQILELGDFRSGSITAVKGRCGKPNCHCHQPGRPGHRIAEDLRAGKVQEVIASLKRLRPKTEELRASLQSLIGYYSENAGRMRHDEYLRLGYGIGSGTVESAHKQVVHARLRQAGMRWSEAGARRLLALRLLLLNGDWALLDRMRMVSLA